MSKHETPRPIEVGDRVQVKGYAQNWDGRDGKEPASGTVLGINHALRLASIEWATGPMAGKVGPFQTVVSGSPVLVVL